MQKFLFFVLFTITFPIFSQTEDAWIFFTDKPQATSFLNNPLSMLSQRALDRRSRHNIPLDITDVPIDNNYLNQIKSATGIIYMAKSKWMNAVHVQGAQSNIENLLNLSFVDHIEFANKNLGTITQPFIVKTPLANAPNKRNNYDYGFGYNQIHQLNGEIMHQQGLTGQSVLLAVIDAGFSEVNTAGIFQPLFQNNKIIDVYNFVSHDNNIYQFSMHGSGVLSTIAAQSNGELVGTAPDVKVALYVSEDVSQEMPIEESYWAEAAERADSLGVDIINTSLGYQTYDRSDYSYTMADLDGHTSFISRAANIAATRGIVVVVSAGNSGGTSWFKIGMPGDAQNVITVGAVDNNGVKTDFSSIGPTADGRIKPDVMALGSNVSAYWFGSIQGVNGTSFSAPITAGMIACMIQAYPDKKPDEIKQDLISISDRFFNPDNQYGYGIPNFSLYDVSRIDKLAGNDNLLIYPIPASGYIKINKDIIYQIFTPEGKYISGGQSAQKNIDISYLSAGIYYLSTSDKIYKIIVK